MFKQDFISLGYDCTVLPFRRALFIGKFYIRLWPLYAMTFRAVDYAKEYYE